MSNQKNSSIEKIDEQIKKLTINNDGFEEETPKLNKKEFIQKIKLQQLDDEIEQNKKKKISQNKTKPLEKTIVMNKIDDKLEKQKEQELRKLYKDKKIISKKNKKKNPKKSMISKKEEINRILDNQDKVNHMIKKLTYTFLGLLSFLIIIFIIICLI